MSWKDVKSKYEEQRYLLVAYFFKVVNLIGGIRYICFITLDLKMVENIALEGFTYTLNH